jgi:uncharacterized protein
MTAYFDTSAAVKLVVDEPGTEIAVRLWEGAQRVVSSVLLYPEARAALKRVRRERRLADDGLRDAIVEFERIWQRIERVGVSVDLATRAGALAHSHDLRGYDAIHLASAEVTDTDLVFVAADSDLCAAATRLGLAVARLPR